MFGMCNHSSTFIFGFSALVPLRYLAGSAYAQAAQEKSGVAGFDHNRGGAPRCVAWGNLAGAIPVIGGIPVGLIRIVVGMIICNLNKYEGSALIGRGLVEIAGGGPLLFLIDVFFTLGRLLPRAPVDDIA